FPVTRVADAAAAQVWNSTATDGSAAAIDMLTISLDGTKTLTSVTVNDTNGWGALAILLAGLTISTPDPAPAPQPTCSRPGNSCNTPAAENSQAQKWLPSTRSEEHTSELQ